MKKPAFTENQQFCIDCLAEVFCGRHHLPEPKPFGRGVEINHYGELSTFDSSFLTRLVVLAHKHAVRISIQSSGPRMVKITAFRRQHETPKVPLHMFDRHPDLNGLIELCNANKETTNEPA